jgi:putative phosphoesterase
VHRIGLISDTHGLLRPEAIAFLRGCDHIVHAGDVGNAQIIGQLASLAALTVVRGNNDKGAWAEALAETGTLDLGETQIFAIHDLSRLEIDPRAACARVVVSGHSHKPFVRNVDGVLYVNPGSAGPRRFSLPVSIGELHIDGASVTPRLVRLNCRQER